jgi:hypothetical protein
VGRTPQNGINSNTLPRDLAQAVEVYGIDATAIQKLVAGELEAKRAARRAKSTT